jgi:homopolymeric O-antigen transport system permease protein
MNITEVSPQKDALIIEPGRIEKNDWTDLWRYRDLFLILAWAILRPVLTMIVFTLIFGQVAGLPSEGNTPYPILVFSGLLPWVWASTSRSV